MHSRLSTLALALAATALLAACGGGGDKGAATTQQGTPTTREQAVQRCLEEAGKLSGDARKTAEAACRAGTTGNTTAVKSAARQQCLDAAKNIPDEAARKRAESACESSTR